MPVEPVYTPPMPAAAAPPQILLPDAPVLIAGIRDALWLTADGEVEILSHNQSAAKIRNGPAPVVCHRISTATRLGMDPFAAFDLLELFVFARPATFCLPTPAGIAEALDLPLPTSHGAEAESLLASARRLLEGLSRRETGDRTAIGVAWAMERSGWPWAKPVLAALGAGEEPHSGAIRQAFKAWDKLPKWEEGPGYTPADSQPVAADESRQRLSELLGGGAEDRPQQSDYAAAAAEVFGPCNTEGEPRMLLAEAGTGTGKTLGYIAPASIWADRNRGTVWFSTYTRNLQRQLDGELDRLYPEPDEKVRRVVVRKGRENYFCLLNFEDSVNRMVAALVGGGAARPGDGIALGLMARWVVATRDGDMAGGDFPAWLTGLLGRGATTDLTDTRGECIYSACAHYGKCFIERSVRRARRARIVVANHALVMAQAAYGAAGAAAEEGGLPTRYVFDEGHQIFDAADSTFSSHLSGREASDLRRWILGAEDRRSSRSRGLKARLEDFLGANDKAAALIDEIRKTAHVLPGMAWNQRIAGGQPSGAAEEFLTLVRQQVYARDPNTSAPYSLECVTTPPVDGLADAARGLEKALAGLVIPAERLINLLADLLDEDSDDLDTQTRQRIEAAARSLERRLILPVAGWRDMLRALDGKTPPEFVDWFNVDRIDGRDIDIGLHRHWVDPSKPFADAVLKTAHGALVTSATLTDQPAPKKPKKAKAAKAANDEPPAEAGVIAESAGAGEGSVVSSSGATDGAAPSEPASPDAGVGEGAAVSNSGAGEGAGAGGPSTDPSDTATGPSNDNASSWESADRRTGSLYVPGVGHTAFLSPFDYAKRTRVLVVGDVNRNNPDQVAAAYRELFKASNGGGLGLFTAISRLRATHGRIASALEETGIPVYAQHVDAMDTGTLIDIFRAEIDACLLGADAVRDGIDVPGRSLRLIVFDRVPWPRPNILHRARRDAFGGREYDEMLTRLRLKQAYGRLVRRADDRGVFVLLDRGLPSRLATAFPEGVAIERIGLKDAIAETRSFLAEDDTDG